MLAQVSLGLLLFERREQESRAKLQNGEISHKLQLHEKAITVIYWTVISSRGFFNNNNFQLINYITNVFVIIYLGLVIPPNFGVYENTSLAYCPQTLNFRSYTICFKNASGYFQARNVVEERFTNISFLWGSAVSSRTDSRSVFLV